MRVLGKTLVAISALGVLGQIGRPAHAVPSVGSPRVASPAVEDILRSACYDCHSNETRWPWYGDVAPFSWLIDHDVTEGRRRLNFSYWAEYASDPGTLSQKLDQISHAVASGEMAPWYYRVLHPGARLSAAQRGTLIDWATHAASDSLRSP
jgi:hypothetical protein